MPRFKTNINVFEDLDEYFIEDWFKSNTLVLPETFFWKRTNLRPMTVKDVDLWEVLFEASTDNGFFGVYSAWRPYEELFIITLNKKIIAQFLGEGSVDKVNDHLKNKNMMPVFRYNNSSIPIFSKVKV